VTTRWKWGAAVCLAALLGGCESELKSPSLEELTPPATEFLEEGVRRQLSEAHQRLNSAGGDEPTPDSSRLWGELGQLYDAYDFEQAAATCYRNAAMLEPEAFVWHYLSARLARARGDLEAAERALARALELEPNDDAARVESARVQVDQGNLEEALRIVERVLDGDTNEAAALLLRAEIFQAQENWAAAASDYERLLVLQPGATRLHLPLANAYRRLELGDRADQHIALRGDSPVSVVDPWVLEIRNLRSGVKHVLDAAEAAFAAGDFAAAEDGFSTAVERDPANARAHLGRGSALRGLGRFDDALVAYDEALLVQPGYALAHYNRGTVLALDGDDAAAIEAYDAALRSNPEYTGAQFNRANALRRSGRLEEAEAGYLSLIEDDPGNGSAHLGRATCMVLLGRDAEAVAALEAADGLFPSSPTFKNALARVWATSSNPAVRDPTRALDYAQRLVSAAATVPHVETLAMAQAATGDFEAAIATIESLIEAVARAGGGAASRPFQRRLEAFRRGEAPRAADLG